jgi:hypothetical protein
MLNRTNHDFFFFFFFKNILTLISCHFSSVERNEPHDFTKSNSVFGAFGTGTESSLADSPIENNDVDESDFGGFVKVGLPLSRGWKIVLLPEARNMPPPTRLGLALSLACLASLNEFILEPPFAGGGSVEVLDGESLSSCVSFKETLLLLEDASFKEREDIGSKVSVLTFDGEDNSETGDSWGTEGPGTGTADEFEVADGGSIIFIGTRRRLFADEESNEAWRTWLDFYNHR